MSTQDFNLLAPPANLCRHSMVALKILDRNELGVTSTLEIELTGATNNHFPCAGMMV